MLLAGLIYISSSGIVTRALFDLRRLGDDETDLVLGVLVFEDLAIALFLGIAAALATGESVGGLEIAGTAGLALAFVVAFLLVGRWAHHAIDRIGPRLDREQLLLGGARDRARRRGPGRGRRAVRGGRGAPGRHPAVRAARCANQIEQQLLGLRDFAAAIFFFAFGLEVDLGRWRRDVADWLLLAVPVAMAGKLVGGYLAGRATSFTRRESVNVGAALVARGEFTIILANLAAGGVALDAAFRESGEPFAGLFVLATAVAGVVLMRESRRIGQAGVPDPRRRAER